MSARPPLARGDVVLVSFPFTDLSGDKVRPALVVARVSNDDTILAFITRDAASVDRRAEHRLLPSDPDFAGTGLKTAVRVRLDKLATLHRGLVRRRLGRIGPQSLASVAQALRHVFQL